MPIQRTHSNRSQATTDDDGLMFNGDDSDGSPNKKFCVSADDSLFTC